MARQQDNTKEKINVRDRLVDNVLDLSLMNISKVPVEDIKVLRRATILDLSSNRISIVESNFTDLTQLTQIDLSKNRITALCDDFGLLSSLRRLDLYKNQITRLPLTFGRLRNLKYLDLKENPLNPTLKKHIGTCSDTADCLSAAGRAVDFMKQVERRVLEERTKDRKAREEAQRLQEDRKKEENVPVEDEKSPDELKPEKTRRRRKQIPQSETASSDETKDRKTKTKRNMKNETDSSGWRLPSLLWMFMLLLLAATYVLYLKYYDTVQSVRDGLFQGPQESILEEYIK